MLNDNLKRVLQAKTIYAGARLVGDSVLDQIDRLRAFVRSLLKSFSKGWSLFKDFHFGWYVIIPVVSSTSAFGDAAAILAWGGFALLIGFLLLFMLLDSVLDLDDKGRLTAVIQSRQGGHAHPPAVREAPRRARSTYEPLQSRWSQSGLRRSGVRRAARTRGFRG